MARLFGTDGVRGVANKELTCQMAFQLGQAAVAFKGRTILIGRTRACPATCWSRPWPPASRPWAARRFWRASSDDAGHRASDARAALRRRHRHLRVAQPAGVQRHQDLRRPGLQAARRCGGRDRGVHGPRRRGGPTSCRTATRSRGRAAWTTPASCTSSTPLTPWPSRASTSRA